MSRELDWRRDGMLKRYDAAGNLISRGEIPPGLLAEQPTVIGEKMLTEAQALIEASPRGREGARAIKSAPEAEEAESNSAKRSAIDEQKLAKMPWLAEPDDPVARVEDASTRMPLETAPTPVKWGAWTIRLRNKDLARLEQRDPTLVLYVPAEEYEPYLVDLKKYSDKDLALWRSRISRARAVYPASCEVPPRTRRREIFVYVRGEEPSIW